MSVWTASLLSVHRFFLWFFYLRSNNDLITCLSGPAPSSDQASTRRPPWIKRVRRENVSCLQWHTLYVHACMHPSVSQSVRLKTLNFLFKITGFIIWRDIDFSRRWNISRLYTYYVRVYYNDAEEGRIKPALWILDVIKSMFYLFPRK